MTRDEVLERLDASIAVGNEKTCVASTDLLRAAAELIRQSGWRPISEAPKDGYITVGRQWLGEWEISRSRKFTAEVCGYTHYLPEPEPYAREVENG